MWPWSQFDWRPIRESCTFWSLKIWPVIQQERYSLWTVDRQSDRGERLMPDCVCSLARCAKNIILRRQGPAGWTVSQLSHLTEENAAEAIKHRKLSIHSWVSVSSLVTPSANFHWLTPRLSHWSVTTSRVHSQTNSVRVVCQSLQRTLTHMSIFETQTLENGREMGQSNKHGCF